MNPNITRQKGLHKQLLSDVVDALACVYCYFLRAELNGENAIAGFSFAGLMFPGGEMPVRIFAGLIFACGRLPVKVCR